MKSDLIGAAIIGVLISALFLVLSYMTLTVLKPEESPPLYYWSSLAVFPALTTLGILVLNDLRKRILKLSLLFQFYKFALVGVMNTLLDLSVLNALIVATGITSGWQFSLFKGISFIIAVTNSYFWNKLWTFQAKENGAAPVEFGKFLIVSLGGLAINVGIASFLVNVIGVPYGINPQIWASIAALAAIAITMFWNFAGYKLLVFRSPS